MKQDHFIFSKTESNVTSCLKQQHLNYMIDARRAWRARNFRSQRIKIRDRNSITARAIMEKYIFLFALGPVEVYQFFTFTKKKKQKKKRKARNFHFFFNFWWKIFVEKFVYLVYSRKIIDSTAIFGFGNWKNRNKSKKSIFLSLVIFCFSVSNKKIVIYGKNKKL